MTRCYVCNADDNQGCQAIGGEVAECPRPSATPAETMVFEARAALAAHSRNDVAAYELHRANARRIAEQLDLQVVHTKREREEATA